MTYPLKYPKRKGFRLAVFTLAPVMTKIKVSAQYLANYALITTCLSVRIGVSVPGLRQDERFKSFFKVTFYEESNRPVHCFQNLRSLEKPAVALHCKQLLSDG